MLDGGAVSYTHLERYNFVFRKDATLEETLEVMAKEQARLAAIYELEQKKKQEQLAKAQKSAKAVTGFVGNVILWIITVFFGLFAILCVLPSESLSGAIYDLSLIHI